MNSSNTTEKFAIDCQKISVQYLLASHRYSGLKDLVLNFSKHRAAKKKFTALDNVTLQIPRGQSVALIGHNGCGKSTLLKVIAGVISPQQGSVTVKGRIGPMIELGAGFDHELSGRENIELSCMLMGLGREEIRAKTPAIIEFASLGEFIDSPIKNYSSGMVARIGFACATAINPNVLLVDEVLSVGDTNFASKCLERIKQLRESGSTVVLVSHDMNAVKSFCDRAVVLEEGNVIYDGNVYDGVAHHLDVMHSRMSKNLTAIERQEAARVHALNKGAILGGSSKAKVKVTFIQDSKNVLELDCARAFSIEVKVEFENHQKVEDGLAIGFAFTENERIITGFNNLDLGYIDPAKMVRESKSVLAIYSFPTGMPEISSQNQMEILCGIHDQRISRELFYGKVATLKVSNSIRGENRHRYMVDLADRIKNFEIRPLE